MQIPVTLSKRWKKMKSHGDHGKIASAYEMENGEAVHVDTIRRAMRSGKASDLVFKAIANYYEKKGAEIKSFQAA